MKCFGKIWFLLMAVALIGCDNTQTPSSPEEEALYELECTIARRPTEVKQALDTLNLDALSKKELAHYCLLKTMVNDVFFDYSEQTDSLLQVAQQFFISGSDPYFEAKTYEAVARVGFKRGMTLDHKLELELKGLQSIENCQHVDERLLQCQPEGNTEKDFINDYKYKLIWRLGLDYGMGDYYDEALDCFTQVYQYFEQRQNPMMCIWSAYSLGIDYMYKHEYDSSWKYLDLSLQKAQQAGNVEECVKSYLALSGYYQYRAQSTDDKEEEVSFLRQSISEAFKGLELLGDRPRIKDALFNSLSEDYSLLGQHDSCVYYGEKQLEITKRLFGIIAPNDTHAKTYHRLFKSYEALGNNEKALYYAQRCLDTKDELADQSKNVEQIKGEYEKRLEMQRLEAEQQMKRYQLYLMLLLSLLTLVIVVWINFRYRKNKEIEDLKFQEEFQRMQTHFEQSSQHTKNLLIQRVTDIYRSNNADNALEHIIHEFELQYPSVLDKISKAYPNLTKTEKHIVILSFLNFRAKEEADLLGLSENTVMKYRSNIKKKVDENLYMLFL